MHRLSGKIVIASLGLVIAGLGTVWAINWLRPNLTDRRPNLVDVPPLAPVSRSSRIVMPAAIALTALSEAMERVPRELSGKSENPTGSFQFGDRLVGRARRIRGQRGNRGAHAFGCAERIASGKRSIHGPAWVP